MAYREFTDGEGRGWRAWDTRPQSTMGVAPELADGWLCFESEAEKRRLAPIPEDWQALPEERLVLLLRLAELVPSRPGDPRQAPPLPPAP